LSVVLQDVEVSLSEQELNDEQKEDLQSIADSCRNVLYSLEKSLSKYDEPISDSGAVDKRAKRVWKRLNWEPEEITELRSRIVANIALLKTFQLAR
jgi:hypothetical protein